MVCGMYGMWVRMWNVRMYVQSCVCKEYYVMVCIRCGLVRLWWVKFLRVCMGFEVDVTCIVCVYIVYMVVRVCVWTV